MKWDFFVSVLSTKCFLNSLTQTYHSDPYDYLPTIFGGLPFLRHWNPNRVEFPCFVSIVVSEEFDLCKECPSRQFGGVTESFCHGTWMFVGPGEWFSMYCFASRTQRIRYRFLRDDPLQWQRVCLNLCRFVQDQLTYFSCGTFTNYGKIFVSFTQS